MLSVAYYQTTFIGNIWLGGLHMLSVTYYQTTFIGNIWLGELHMLSFLILKLFLLYFKFILEKTVREFANIRHF